MMKPVTKKSEGASAEDLSVTIVLHGDEHQAKGGPSVLAKRSALVLNNMGINTRVQYASAMDLSGVAHVLNIWPPHTCLKTLHAVRSAGHPCVFSPIYMNLDELFKIGRQLPVVLKNTDNEKELLAALDRIRDLAQSERLWDPSHSMAESMPGYFEQVREALSCSDAVICLSELERTLLQQISAMPEQTAIVHNGIDVQRFRMSDPALFQEATGLTDYVLCVGRLEERKNQALLAYAMKDLSLPLVFIGHTQSPKYARLVRKHSGPNVRFIGHIPHDGDLLPSAFAGARVLAMPSWVEGAPLVALEAGAAGCRLVLSNRSGEQEYFDKHALYCDPGDYLSIRNTVIEAYESPLLDSEKLKQQEFIASRYDLSHYAAATWQVYSDLIDRWA